MLLCFSQSRDLGFERRNFTPKGLGTLQLLGTRSLLRVVVVNVISLVGTLFKTPWVQLH